MTNEQSVDDALSMFANAFCCKCTAKEQKINENKVFTNRYFQRKSIFITNPSRYRQKANDKVSISFDAKNNIIIAEKNEKNPTKRITYKVYVWWDNLIHKSKLNIVHIFILHHFPYF